MLVCILIALLCSACSFTQKPSYPLSSESASLSPLDSTGTSPFFCTSKDNASLEAISQEARRRLEAVPVHEHSCTKAVGHKTIAIPGREIALAVCSPSTNTIDVVLVRLCYEDPDALEVMTPGYEVVRKNGKGITRFTFDVTRIHSHEQLLLLDSKHWMQESGVGEYYFPYSDRLMTESVVSAGADTLTRIIHDAFGEARRKNTPSLAFDGKRLHEVFPRELFFNLALIEQMDDDEFFNDCPRPETLAPENRIFKNCSEYAAYKVLVHYARNGRKAFSYVFSKAGAKGAMQFMPETYKMVLRQYSFAGLIPSFENGASDIVNAIQAAMCLLDFDMVVMHKGIKYEFLRNPRLGSIYLMAAYNGGTARAERLYRSLGVRRRCCQTVEQVPTLNREVARETNGYIIKYVGLWDILDNSLASLNEKTPD